MNKLEIHESYLKFFGIKNLNNETRKLLFNYYEMCLDHINSNYINDITKIKNNILRESFNQWKNMILPKEFNCKWCKAGLKIIKNVIPISIKCPDCDGTGILMKACNACDKNGMDEDHQACRICKGTKKYFFKKNFYREENIPCRTCLGTTKKIIDFKETVEIIDCPNCNGIGFDIKTLRKKEENKLKELKPIFDIFSEKYIEAFERN